MQALRLKDNRDFLKNYASYIHKEWGGYYFAYDYFKSEYKKRKGMSLVDMQDLDNKLLVEIQRVYNFLDLMTSAADSDLTAISAIIDRWQADPSTETDRNIELSLRSVYRKICLCEDFFKLNHFAISKVCKKMEKLPLKEAETPVELSVETQELLAQFNRHKDRYLYLDGFKSGIYFYEVYYSALERIEATKQRCIDVYMLKFRRTYGQLAHYELLYIKNKDNNVQNVAYIGIKLGLAICVILWIVVDTNTVSNDLNFWQQPGLFVYTTVGNLLLYRLGWAFQVSMWSKYDVNYVSALSLGNAKPKLDLLVIEKTSNLLLMYAINMLIFFKANSEGSILSNTFLSYACPVLLIIGSIFNVIYEFLFVDERHAYGIFSQEVFLNCFKAPMVPVRFRDVYAADVLTSFTRIIADSLYATCWIFSGSVFYPRNADGTTDTASDFGSSYAQCTNHDMQLFVGAMQMIPLITRALQCLRSCRDAKWKVFPQGYNFLKYLLSMIVIVVALIDNGKGFTGLYAIVIITALYKWWWDIVMDWGLGEVLPHRLDEALRLDTYLMTKMWLRHVIMYPSVLAYYLCIFLDLVLRFTWVMSLLPGSAIGGLVGNQLSFFLGSLEIIRRAMWGCFRIEWEHIKLLKQGSPGFLSSPVIRGFSNARRRSCAQIDVTSLPL